LLWAQELIVRPGNPVNLSRFIASEQGAQASILSSPYLEGLTRRLDIDPWAINIVEVATNPELDGSPLKRIG
jgi:hypothetical protein